MVYKNLKHVAVPPSYASLTAHSSLPKKSLNVIRMLLESLLSWLRDNSSSLVNKTELRVTAVKCQSKLTQVSFMGFIRWTWTKESR